MVAPRTARKWADRPGRSAGRDGRPQLSTAPQPEVLGLEEDLGLGVRGEPQRGGAAADAAAADAGADGDVPVREPLGPSLPEQHAVIAGADADGGQLRGRGLGER